MCQIINFASFFFLYPSVFNLKEVAAVDIPQVHLWVLYFLDRHHAHYTSSTVRGSLLTNNQLLFMCLRI